MVVVGSGGLSLGLQAHILCHVNVRQALMQRLPAIPAGLWSCNLRAIATRTTTEVRVL